MKAMAPPSHTRGHRMPTPHAHTTLPPLHPTQIVYEFLLRYVVSNDTDAKTAKRYIDQVRGCMGGEGDGIAWSSVAGGGVRCGARVGSRVVVRCVAWNTWDEG